MTRSLAHRVVIVAHTDSRWLRALGHPAILAPAVFARLPDNPEARAIRLRDDFEERVGMLMANGMSEYEARRVAEAQRRAGMKEQGELWATK